MGHATKYTLVPALVLALIDATASAETDSAQASDDDLNPIALPLVEVVAQPIIEGNFVDGFGFNATVISSDQIENLNALDLASALRRTPGVTISRFNPVGAFGGGEGGAVFIRGRGQSRPGADIQTYIDGVPVYMGIWNHPLMDILPLNAIEQINVYKSPQPHRFGGAMAAVELQTRRQPVDGSQGHSRAAAGEFSTRMVQADQGWGDAQQGVLLAGSYMSSDGDRDDSDGELKSAFLRMGRQIDRHWALDFLALGSDNKASDPGPVGRPDLKNGDFETRLGLVAIGLSHQHENATGEIKVYYTDGRGYWYEQANGSDTLTDFNGDGLRARETLFLGQGTEVVLGLDIERMTGDVRFRPNAGPQTQFDGPTLRTISPYAAINRTFQLGDWSLTPSAGLRYYDHNKFDAETSPHAAVVLERGPLALRANASRGANYPGLDVIVFSSNVIPPLGDSWRDLDAETVDHYEVGLTYEVAPGLVFDIAAFWDNGSNRYVFVPPPPPPPFWTNVGGADINGVEASVSWEIDRDWSVFAATTLLDPSPSTVPYVPRNAHVLGLNGRINRWRVSLDAQRVGSQYVLSQGRSATAVNTERVDSFLLVNGRVGYQWRLSAPSVELFLAAENLGDENYEYRPDYPMPGRWAMAGFSMRW